MAHTTTVTGCFFGVSSLTPDFARVSAKIVKRDSDGEVLESYSVSSVDLFVKCAEAHGILRGRGHLPAKDGMKEKWTVFFHGRFTVIGDVEGEIITPTSVEPFDPSIEINTTMAKFFASAPLEERADSKDAGTV